MDTFSHRLITRLARIARLAATASVVVGSIAVAPVVVSTAHAVAPKVAAHVNPSIGAQTVPTWSNTNIIAVDTGYEGACAIQGSSPSATSGVLFCWGKAAILGTGSNSSSNVPVAVTAADGFNNTAVTAVAVGSDHACAIEGGKLWCWGGAFVNGSYGVLGTGGVNSSTPKAVSTSSVAGFDNDGANGDAVTAVDAAYSFTCAVEGVEVYCWGNNQFSNLGLGASAPGVVNRPMRVVDTATPGFQAASATAVQVGFYHACALASGSAYCWGFNNDGRLGNTTPATGLPTAVAKGDFNGSNSNLTAIGLGNYFSCGVQGGKLRCWGEGTYNQLGTGNTNNAATPTNVAAAGSFTNNGQVTSVSAGEKHTCAIQSGVVYCWGNNADGQLGLGNNTDSSTALPVSASVVPGFANNGNVTAVSANSNQTCAIEGGVVYCWGNSMDGRLGLGLVYGNQTKPVKVFVVSAPAAPTISVMASGASGQLSVGVTKPNDGGSTITSYEYSVDNGTPVSVAFGGMNLQQISISNLTNGTSYSIKVRAVNAAGTGPWSAPSSGTPTSGGGGGGGGTPPVTPSPNSIGSSMSNMCTGGQGMTLSGSTSGTFDFMVSMCSGTNVYVGVEGPSSVIYSFKNQMNNWVNGSGPTVTPSAPTKADLQSFPRSGTLGIQLTFTSTGTYKIYTVNETCYNSLASSSALVSTCSTNNYGYWTINIGGGGGGIPQPSACTAGAASSNNQAITFDTSFGTGGAIDITPSGKSLFAIGSAKTASGKLLLAVGYSASNGPGGGYLLMRFGSDGTPDSTFGTNGVKTVPSANSGTNINIGSVVANNDGTFFVSLSESTYSNSNTTTVGKLLKLDANGDLVASFGTGGAATLATTSGNGGVYIGASKVLANGSVMVLANEYGGQSSVGKIYKVSSTGTLDSSFATAGVLTLNSSPRDFTVDDSGRIVVAGNTGGVSANATVTRYSAAGALDSTFGTSGVVTVDTSSSRELGYQVDIAGGKFYLLDQISAGGMSLTATVRIVRLNADGTIDTTYGSNGYADAATGSYMFRTMTVAPSGAATVGLYSTGMSMDAAVVFLDANGAALAGTGTTPMTISAGTCGLSDFDFISVDSSVFVIGSNFSGMDEKGFIIKANLSGIDFGSNAGGGSVANAPTLVTSANQSSLEREPGDLGMIVNGQGVEVTTTRLNSYASLTPALYRTPEQVKSVQAAGAALLAAFIATLPTGTSSNLQVINTATGAVMRNLVFDENGNSLDIPVEDIVLLDSEVASIMIGSNNAYITQDGKYQVGTGSRVGLTGSGFGANANGELIVMSTPTLLGSFIATSAGEVSASAALPGSLALGDHTLVAASNGIYAVMGIRVVPAALPATGGSGQRTVVIALFTMVFAAIIFRGRRLSLV